MSTDPSGILFCGFPLPALIVDYHDLNEEWEKEFRPKEPKDKSNYRTPEWDDWRERLAEWEATVQNVKIDWSGAENCEQYYLHCAGLEKSVDWNDLLVINDLSIPADAERMLHQFCDRFNLPKKSPQWHLAARYF